MKKLRVAAGSGLTVAPSNRETVTEQGPLVSIVVPVYNTDSSILHRCLTSLLIQTYANIEILVVDDGSVVSSLSASLSQTLDDRIRVFVREHEGVSAARNFGIENAKGDYIAFADADDEVCPRFVEEALKTAIDTNADIVCGRITYSFEGKRFEEPLGYGVNAPFRIIDAKRDIDDLTRRFLTYWPVKNEKIPPRLPEGPVAKLYRRDAIANVRFPIGIELGEDSLFNAIAASMATVVTFYDAAWYIYYQYSNSSNYSTDTEAALRRRAVGFRMSELDWLGNAWCARDCHHLFGISERFLRLSLMRYLGKTRDLLRKRESVEAFQHFEQEGFELAVWWKLACAMMRRGLPTATTVLLAAKVFYSKARGKRIRRRRSFVGNWNNYES